MLKLALRKGGDMFGDVVELPGPESQALLEEQEVWESSARTYPRGIPIALKRGSGAILEDVDGNYLIDFVCGAGALPLGHSPSEIKEAVSNQLDHLAHGLDFHSPVRSRFMKAIMGILPKNMKGKMKAHFCSPTGADTVEAAIKLCKTATGRGGIVAFHGGYHGCTAGAMSVTGNLGPRAGVQNTMPGVHVSPFSHCQRCPLGLEPKSCKRSCAALLESLLDDPNSGVPLPAAIIVEPVQGEGGVIVADVEFLQRIGKLAKKLNIPLIVDEVQTGMGRCGSWFGFEKYGIEPDVICLSKAAGGMGMPIGLMLYRKELDVWSSGAHIGTFRGNQLAFAAGEAFIRIAQRDSLLENVERQGTRLLCGLRRLAEKFRTIGMVRGVGLMLGMEIVDPETGNGDPAMATELRRQILSRGLILELGGRRDTVLRLLPPLNIDEGIVRQALDILDASFCSIGLKGDLNAV